MKKQVSEWVRVRKFCYNKLVGQKQDKFGWCEKWIREIRDENLERNDDSFPPSSSSYYSFLAKKWWWLLWKASEGSPGKSPLNFLSKREQDRFLSSFNFLLQFYKSRGYLTWHGLSTVRVFSLVVSVHVEDTNILDREKKEEWIRFFDRFVWLPERVSQKSTEKDFDVFGSFGLLSLSVSCNVCMNEIGNYREKEDFNS